jgi:hypothetical protein
MIAVRPLSPVAREAAVAVAGSFLFLMPLCGRGCTIAGP